MESIALYGVILSLLPPDRIDVLLVHSREETRAHEAVVGREQWRGEESPALPHEGIHGEAQHGVVQARAISFQVVVPCPGNFHAARDIDDVQLLTQGNVVLGCEGKLRQAPLPPDFHIISLIFPNGDILVRDSGELQLHLLPAFFCYTQFLLLFLEALGELLHFFQCLRPLRILHGWNALAYAVLLRTHVIHELPELPAQIIEFQKTLDGNIYPLLLRCILVSSRPGAEILEVDHGSIVAGTMS